MPLVRVAVWGALDDPFCTLPKFSAVGVKVTPAPPATVKLLELVAVPAGVVTLIGPVVAPLGTEAVIWVSEFTVNAADVPLKATEVAPVSADPEIVTLVPTDPLVGENELMLGGTVTVKLLELVAVPLGVVTLIEPVVAPLGTDVAIWVSEFTVNCAGVPLKATLVAPVNPAPLIVTLVPTVPLVGENVLMLGGTVTVKLLELVAVPLGVVTLQ
ncbi:MAG: hypothetical protein LAO07_11310 [Acidobacteriia bacterium]|nr:hypothetical protein [Terriglobia bacterium]